MKDIIILSTGEELIRGSIVDTNSAFLSGRLFNSGFNVLSHLTLGDNTQSISDAIQHSLDAADIVFVTGGLGPTDDDNTIKAVQALFGCTVVIDEKAEKKMRSFFTKIGRENSEKDLKMVEVPEGAIVLDNTLGLAPGFIIENKGKILIAMPGVPREMVNMYDTSVHSYLCNRFPGFSHDTLVFAIVGMKESDINEKINASGIISGGITWGVTAASGIATVTVLKKNGIIPEKEKIIQKIKEIFKDRMLAQGFRYPEEELLFLLQQNGFTLAVAESCTGGLISKRITDTPGSSRSFLGALTAYSNEIKTRILGVSEDTLVRHGAVSEMTATEMASGIKKLMASDIGVSTTGIAGPGGGSDEKPVGTVCFGFNIDGTVITFTRQVEGDREWVRSFSSLITIDFLRTYLKIHYTA